LPTGFYFYGKKRWVCYGTQVNNGTISWEVIDENGVCSSYQSQSIGQSFRELNVVCEQCESQAIRGTIGFGTALKPGWESIVVARKPLSEKNVAKNILRWGTGGINIDGSRISLNGGKKMSGGCKGNRSGRVGYFLTDKDPKIREDNTKGRFPANLILECICDEVVEGKEITKEPEEVKGGIWQKSEGKPAGRTYKGTGTIHTNPLCPCYMLDTQQKGVSRFFYCAKASRSERNIGCEGLEDKSAGMTMRDDKFTREHMGNTPTVNRKPIKNNHPTIKPLALCEYLVKLVTPPKGICLDPFAGSGTTLIACKNQGFNFIGIEKESEYVSISLARLKATKISLTLF